VIQLLGKVSIAMSADVAETMHTESSPRGREKVRSSSQVSSLCTNSPLIRVAS